MAEDDMTAAMGGDTGMLNYDQGNKANPWDTPGTKTAPKWLKVLVVIGAVLVIAAISAVATYLIRLYA